ncbi:spermidine synthase-like isoform X2 [Ptychodera flava]|uniref:spermidine synthase-like isoform X2 n=1 Tax=Ptychodera flava TaxID=63121 RepID=UPI003969FF7E
MNTIKDGWFSEFSPLWPGQCMSLEVDEILYEGRSKFQDVIVFRSKSYGNVLILDGVIQCTERDEYSYQEMITFLPLNSHPNPKNKVIEVSKKYLPAMSVGFSSPKLTQHIGDGFDFMANHTEEFDVIITDSSDPIGPAESLFEKPYYELMKTALKPNGIICSQGECMWLHLPLIKKTMEMCKSIYPVVSYGYCTIPTYPSGQIGFVLCSLNPDTNFAEPLIKWTDEEVTKLNLKYYNTDIHRAAIVLPQHVRKTLNL